MDSKKIIQNENLKIELENRRKKAEIKLLKWQKAYQLAEEELKTYTRETNISVRFSADVLLDVFKFTGREELEQLRFVNWWWNKSYCGKILKGFKNHGLKKNFTKFQQIPQTPNQ